MTLEASRERRPAGTVAERLARAGRCRSRSRPGWSSFLSPVRAAAGPRLPVVRDRHDRRRPREAAARPDARGRRAVRRSASPSCSCAGGALFGGLGAAAVRAPRAASRGSSASLTIVLGPGLPGRAARAAARPADPPAARPRGWPARRCSAWSSASAGRPASARPSASSSPSAFNEGSAGRGALLGVAYCLGLGLPFVLVAGWRTAGRWAPFGGPRGTRS